MSLARILCLANSYKHENRCVAGINLVTGKWIRLVGHKVPGCLTLKEVCYPDGKEAALLDVFEAELGEECRSNSHPEDVFVTERPWLLLRRFGDRNDVRLLETFVNKNPALLQGYGDRVYTRKLEGSPADRSLDLIHPDDLWWWIRDETGKRKNRAIFRAGYVSRTRYDLAVTDPIWLEKLHSMPPGIYPHARFFTEKPAKTFLTISLSEPFDGFHYKLVAGVVNLTA
jgi:hypothetical protein